MHRCLRMALAVAFSVWAAAAAARPYTVDDLLRQETFGAAALDPGGRWFVFERTAPYDTARRFDNDVNNSLTTSRLMVVDLARPAPARPLLAADAPEGQVIAAFSPHGERLAITRYTGRTWTLGVVDMASGAVRWFDDITPEKSILGRGLQWRSDRELVVINHPDGVPAWPLRIGHVSADRVPQLWEAAATGRGAHTVFGSGAYAGLQARPPASELLDLDVVTGQRRRLALGFFQDLEVAPDGRRVAVLERGDAVQSRAGEAVQGAQGIETETGRLSIVGLAAGASRAAACGRCDALPYLLTWSPDGRALLAYMRTPGATWAAGRLVRIDATTGALRPVGETLTPQFLMVRPTIVAAGWMGEDPILFARPGATPDARPDWWRLTAAGPVNLTDDLPPGPWKLVAADRDSLAVIAGGQLWRVDRRGAAQLVASAPVDLVRTSQERSAGRPYNIPPTEAWVATGRGATRELRRLDRDGLHPSIPWTGATSQVLWISEPTAQVVDAGRDDHGVEFFALHRAGGPELRLAEINASLDEVDPPRVLPIRHSGPDGQALTSWLLLPPRAPGAAAPPMVIRPYSGSSYPEPPEDLTGERGFVGHYRTLVGHGYAVLVPSLPLPRGRTDPMPGLADRILAIVDAAARDPATAGTFDRDRVALLGHSYGGYTVLAAIGQSDRFRAAISVSGLSDMFSKWETFAGVYRAMPEDGPMFNWSMGSVEWGQDEMFKPPWEDPARYARNSPLYAVDRIHTPVMLMHGDQDVVTLEQSDAMFAALYREDKDAILVTYWGEGHMVDSPGNVRDLYARTFKFLDEHLAVTPGDPPAAGPANPQTAPSARQPAL
jgi:dipeptidyl aminopeptidase/acylaminoacyl peptidase